MGMAARIPSKVQQLVLVRPENRLVLLDVDARHDVVQPHNHIFAVVADNDEEASLLFL